MATTSIPQNTPIQQVPYRQMPNNSVQSLVEGRDKFSNGGVEVRYLELQGVRCKFQIKTIDVTAANKDYDFDFITDTTNDRVVGVILTSDEVESNAQNKYINNSTIQLSIDNEEILPSGFNTKLISAKLDNSFYENIYRINERADGSKVTGRFHCGPKIGEVFVPFTLKLYLWSITKPKK